MNKPAFPFKYPFAGGVTGWGFFIALVSAALFIPGLGAVHLFDWDEINFAESAREMLVTGDYLRVQIDFVPFWEKPPLFFWLQVTAMKIFGVNEFAARLPNALCGIITLLVLYHVGKRLKGQRFGLIWVAAYGCSLLPFFYFKSGIIDPWFNLFIFLGVYYFIRLTSPHRTGNGLPQAALSAFFTGLAMLTKGPVGLLIFLLTFGTYLVIQRFKLPCNWKQAGVFAAVAAFTGGFWYLLLWLHGGGDTIREFIAYQIRLFSTPDAGHGGFLFYHFVILFFGVFPASLLALPAFRRKALRQEDDAEVRHFFRWQMTLFWVVLLLFTIVTTKIVHYSSMCYFPLTFLAAWVADKTMTCKLRIPGYVKALLTAVAALWALLTGMLPFIDRLKTRLLPVVDEFTRGNLEATSSWYGFEPLIGVALLAAVGWFSCFLKKGKPAKAFAGLAGGAAFFITAVIYIYPLQVEKYTQHAVIEFYRSKATEDNYIHPAFRTYAHYFYGQRTPAGKYAGEEWLRTGAIDKPAYFILRKNAADVARFIEETPGAQLLYEKNGFVFLVRKER
ncbi:MAG: glycosyltransferase family 39 protein [Prevotellaceae bacterium]|jgi:4-amino-4-deoxy-L-arabinose transferase-like glycosyltransferase|nr:glycosyltransferase family 39 protein [Prevotellaceae bacterium]